jgi:hypothetical protein
MTTLTSILPNKIAGANAGFRVGFMEAFGPGVAQLWRQCRFTRMSKDDLHIQAVITEAEQGEVLEPVLKQALRAHCWIGRRHHLSCGGWRVSNSLRRDYPQEELHPIQGVVPRIH